MPGHRQRAIAENLARRAKIIRAIREFFNQREYLEVETPVRIPAQAPEAHIDAVPSDGWFLQTSPEICMKRLLSAGYLRIFQLCKCFRKAERGDRHIPEMTMLEWYRANADYGFLMQETEALVRHVAIAEGIGGTLAFQNKSIDLTPPWPRITVAEAFKKYAGTLVETALATDRFDEIMGLAIEPRLGHPKPIFLYDYPIEKGALARKKAGNSEVAERFELYIAGIELCNAFSELNDPIEQRRRFQEELAIRKTLGKTAYPMPEKFLASLNTMPEAAGCALGVDRLVMLFTDSNTIDHVLAFTPEEL